MAETPRQIVERVAREVGVDPALAWAVAMQESGGNPRAHNGNGEDSWGLFQGNRNGGLGSGYSPEQLMDPEFNARLMLSHMAQTQQRTGLTGGELAAASQRPADAKGYAVSVNRMLGGGTGLPHAGSPFSPQGTPAMTTTPKSNTLSALEKQVSDAQADFDRINAERERVMARDPNARLPTTASEAEYEEWSTGLSPLDPMAAKLGETAKPSPKVRQWQDAKERLEKAQLALAKATDDADVLAAKSGQGELRTGKDGKTYWVVGNQATEVQGMGGAEDDGQIINLGQAGGVLLVKKDGTVQELIKGQGERTNLQTINDPATGAVWTYNPTTGQKITQLFEGKPKDPTITTVTGKQGVVTGLNQQTGEQAWQFDPRSPEQQQLDLATAQIALGKAQQLQAALDAANALPAGSVERQQALQGAVMEAARYSDPQVILREAEMEATRIRDEETRRANAAREAETREQNTLTGALTLARDIGTRQSNLAEAQTNFERFGVATPGRLRNLSAMGKEAPMQSEALSMLLQRMGVDPGSPRGQTALNAYGQSFSLTSPTNLNPQAAQQPVQVAPPPAQPQPQVQPQPMPQPQTQGQSAAVFQQGPQERPFDLEGIGAPGWGVNLSLNGDQATESGGIYDIPEQGEQAAPAGPPPGDIASVIEALGFKRKQLQTA